MRWILYTFGIVTSLILWGAAFYVLSHPGISKPGQWFVGACVYSLIVFGAMFTDPDL
jgi:hypothetical protein